MAAPTILAADAAAIDAAARRIAAGEPVAVPTETVYGLAADGAKADAVARIYAAKGRPSFNPLIVHVADRAAAERIAVFDAVAARLADAFWPGPLTLVLPLAPDHGIASLVTAGLDTIAVRVPAHRVMQALLARSGVPLAAPSANRSNGISPTRAEHVADSLGEQVSLILDGGATERGLESTIVRGRAVLRPGPVTAEMLAAVIGRLAEHVSEADVTAPGQLASHYAPSKPLRLDATEARADEWLIGFGPIAGNDTLSSTGDLTEAAARLFDALHRADASQATRIAVAPVPRHGLGAAITDRLARAAHRG